jgi:hypothetical protein
MRSGFGVIPAVEGKKAERLEKQNTSIPSNFQAF